VRTEALAKKRMALARARAGEKPFLKIDYGRTGQSTVRTAERGSTRARPVHQQCTVQCPVHTGLSCEPRQREILKFFKFSI
jgi:hypothetical protein